MKLGIIATNFNFFADINKELCNNFEVRTYQPPIIKFPVGRRRQRIFLTNNKFNRLMKWCDVLFVEWADENLVRATQLKKQCKIITRLHGYEIFKYADKVDWHKVDDVIFVSNAMRNRFLNIYPEMNDKTLVVNNIIDTDKFRPKNRQVRGNIGALGYITPRKRIYDLILAFYEVQKENEDLKLYLGGKSPDWEKYYGVMINELIDKLNLQEKVFLEGYVDNLNDWYNNIDLFVSNSYHEAFHVTLHEAMSCGCYPLVHFWDGAEELVPKENIYITDSELKKKILDYCNWSESKKKDYSKKIRERMEERFGDNKQMKEIVKLIREVGE